MFKPGDKIRRREGTGSHGIVHPGDIVTVTGYKDTNLKIKEDNGTYGYTSSNFELVVSKKSPHPEWL